VTLSLSERGVLADWELIESPLTRTIRPGTTRLSFRAKEKPTQLTDLLLHVVVTHGAAGHYVPQRCTLADVIKPDCHLVRIAQSNGDPVEKMGERLARLTGEKKASSTWCSGMQRATLTRYAERLRSVGPILYR
jgi:hypothetical protein